MLGGCRRQLPIHSSTYVSTGRYKPPDQHHAVPNLPVGRVVQRRTRPRSGSNCRRSGADLEDDTSTNRTGDPLGVRPEDPRLRLLGSRADSGPPAPRALGASSARRSGFSPSSISSTSTRSRPASASDLRRSRPGGCDVVASEIPQAAVGLLRARAGREPVVPRSYDTTRSSPPPPSREGALISAGGYRLRRRDDDPRLDYAAWLNLAIPALDSSFPRPLVVYEDGSRDRVIGTVSGRGQGAAVRWRLWMHRPSTWRSSSALRGTLDTSHQRRA